MKKLQRGVSWPAVVEQAGRYLPVGKPRQLIQRPKLVRNLGNGSRQDQLIQREEEDADTEADEDKRETEAAERDRDFVLCWFLCSDVDGLIFCEFMYACNTGGSYIRTDTQREVHQGTYFHYWSFPTGPSHSRAHASLRRKVRPVRTDDGPWWTDRPHLRPRVQQV